MKDSTTLKVALVDDHILLRSALGSLIDQFDDFKVILQANHGLELMSMIDPARLPDVIILDLNMPVKDGRETAEWLFENHPKIPILMLTVHDSELTMIRMLQLGVRGFLKKDIHPSELRVALHSIMKAGFYYSNQTTGKIVNLFKNSGDGLTNLYKAMLSDQEISFLRFVCSDMTYKEVAQKMGLNPRSIDSLRDQLFIKLDVRSRVGLAMVAIKHGLISL